jgi:hypothetical protein
MRLCLAVVGQMIGHPAHYTIRGGSEEARTARAT